MKTKIKIYFFSLILLLAGSAGVQAQMTIGSQDKPHDGAVLHLKSATKGLLLTNVALNADLTQFVLDGADKQDEAKGMLVYNTTDDKVYFWDGAKWHPLSGNGGSTGEEPSIATVECAGLTFMDRNLGADPTADPNPSSYDAGTNASPTGSLNGDYYQWGRKADGHEKWNSPIVVGSASTTDGNGQVPSSDPRYGKFITTTSMPGDWRTNKDDNLWNETGTGLVNPCPPGFRVPTQLEWDAVNAVITASNRSEIASKHGINVGSTSLFLPAAGYRFHTHLEFKQVGSMGELWSCTVIGTGAYHLNIADSASGTYHGYRAFGVPVRCVKN